MRIEWIIVAFIVACAIAPAYAANDVASDMMSSQDQASIKQQQERIRELRKQLGLDEKFHADKKEAWRSLVAPSVPDAKTSPLPHVYRLNIKDDFDLTNAAVVCFSREGRPVCAPIGSR